MYNAHCLYVLTQGQVMLLHGTLSGDFCLNQSKSERPPWSPYSLFTINSFTFYVSRVRLNCSKNIPKSKAEELGVLLDSQFLLKNKEHGVAGEVSQIIFSIVLAIFHPIFFVYQCTFRGSKIILRYTTLKKTLHCSKKY
jgi:hypothetical protein